MNNKLKKESKKAASYKKYMQRHRMLCVCLDKTADEDIIEWMNEQASISESVRKALRYHINGREGYTDGSTEREAPTGDQKAKGSQQKNQIETSENRLPEADPEDGKRAEDIRSPEKNSRTCKTCRDSRIDYCRQTCYCDNEESENAGQNTYPSYTCSAWR